MKTIKEIRELQNISQQDLAVKAGVGIATISRIELGKCKPNKCTLLVIAGVLNVSPDEIKIIEVDKNGRKNNLS